MTSEQYRAEFDATVTFSNGGSLRADRFRVDVKGPDTDAADVAELFVASLGLLMTEHVDIDRLRIFPEAHKGTRRGPSDPSSHATAATTSVRWVELSHPITAGMTTYPGLPGPEVTPHLTRAESRKHYGIGTEFAIDRISMLGNTGTYVDSPYHRFDGGTDLAGLPLSSLADVPAVVVRLVGSASRSIEPGALMASEVSGQAVLLHTGADRRWGTATYADDAPYLSEAGARWLVEQGALVVGIDSVNIDAIDGDGRRPAHTRLLAAGIPIVEHLTGLEQLPTKGSRFSAVPPRIVNFGTFPVRAYAAVPAPRTPSPHG